MSGHSKWSSIKHKKGAADAKRGKIFSKLNKEITVAARMGGSGDPAFNPRLRVAIQAAKSENMPKENIERAIKKGTGELEGVNYEESVYEGYGPGGAAVLVESLTDNKNRAVANIRHIFNKAGGNLGENGCVAWMFSQKGYIAIESEGVDEDSLMETAIDAGAEDVREDDGQYEIITDPKDFEPVKDAIEALGNDRYRVECGVELGDVVHDIMLPNNFDGVGALTGIPGFVGGAMFMNAGTANGSTCQWLESAEVIGPNGCRKVEVASSMYGYRRQTFCQRDELILRGTFAFKRAEADQREIYEHYMERRRDKQPQGACCGSVFKNPEHDHAGRLLEACGLKGTKLGGAVVSSMHANFIMNENDATFEEILGLIKVCQRTVYEKFHVELQPEVRIIE